MGKDRDYEARVTGMLYALNIAKNEGIEALEKEIKRRGMLRAPFSWTNTQMENFVQEVTHNLYSNMLCTFAYALHVEFGFGKDRLTRLRTRVNELVNDVFDMDYMGEHYVSLTDYATEMNDRYDLGLDVATIDNCQRLQDKPENGYHYAQIERVCQVLEHAGYSDASEFLKNKLDTEDKR